MNAGWQAGDLALCVLSDPHCITGAPNPCCVGGVYTVERVMYDRCGTLGLGLVGVTFPDTNLNADVADCYRKIAPDQHEPCEAEFVTLLKRSRKVVSA